jgi:hypothetical protein
MSRRGRHSSTLQVRARRRAAFAAAAATLCLGVPPAAAQMEGTNGSSGVVLQMKLEKTFLKVDVVRLDVKVEGETADWLRQLADTAAYSDAVADTVTRMVLGADDLTVTLRFLRGASLERFLDEVNGGLRKAVVAGLLDEADALGISTNMPVWYAFLEQRGVHAGDRQVHVISGDRMNTRFIDADGNVLLDHDDTARAGRTAVIASYFAPGSDFRVPLVRSLFR